MIILLFVHVAHTKQKLSLWLVGLSIQLRLAYTVSTIMDHVNGFAAGVAMFQNIRFGELRNADDCITPVKLLLNMGLCFFFFILRHAFVQEIEIMNGKKDPDILIPVWKDTAQLERGMPDLAIP